jgi:cation diffusion facilitator CzcD-associated flavoprotein CzcO
MADDNNEIELSVEELRQRYEAEKLKRIRPEGTAQWKNLKETNAKLDQDPFVEPGFTRDAIIEETTAVIVGGGFGGMLTAIDLTKRGIQDFRIVEKAGDFGGTWYWNRYPGCMCDVESYTYLPLLEETGYMPTERYASATEIFEYTQLMGRTFDLYPHSLFQTEVTDAVWNDETRRWLVTTSRGDQLSTRFLVLAGGILHKPKLPGIQGIEGFAGKAFHTSRWDYTFTGGSATTPMDKLADKRVGIIGTGATAVQAVPQLAKYAKELFVFQRTPSAVGERGQRPTDAEWFKNQKPGWQEERILNFTHCVTGVQPEVDLVQDGWTEVMWENTQKFPESEDEAAALERSDFMTMEKIRRRVDTIVEDAETADKLKAYWGKNCKRVCFHDDYLPAFNRPNVHLVDTNGQGVEEITKNGPVVDGVEYPVDLLIYASGFEINNDLNERLGFDPKGRDGVSLSERWSQGSHTLHGVLASGFPNMLLISLTQGAFGTNFVHMIAEAAKQLGFIIDECESNGIEAIEPEEAAEEEWLMVLYGAAAGGGLYVQTCTPGYYNSELQAPDAKAARNLVYAGSLLEWAGYLEQWRNNPELPGVKLERANAS